jgi:alanyl-tRNA synthetase
MKAMTSAEIRQAFLDYFEEVGHKPVDSSSLVPSNDPTLLFANSGMVQFKDVFLGLDKRDYSRATTSQKSMRVSGKHNDLENVGPSPRHHTFFEMLGNFSFGDYFKRDAIRYAWEVLTKVYQLPVERLAFTVYQSDDEAYNIWVNDIGVDPKRVARMGPKTNFWQMAETGPCGPTSEIHWDKAPEHGTDGIIASLVAEDDRFLELWNLVFMQFNRLQADPAHSGQYDQPLPAPGVDTGMGLERIVSVVQGKTANYDTDLFTPIIAATQRLTGHSDAEVAANDVPYRVIADHIRAATFLIADGVLPGGKGRSAVCRLVIRRAARFGSKIGFVQPFLGTVADAVIATMGDHYTDLRDKAARIKAVITQEEERFRRTLDRGLSELNGALDQLANEGHKHLSGRVAFYLKATLGLPEQVMKDIAEERGFTLDMEAFLAEEEKHSHVSGGGQAMGKIASAESYAQVLADLKASGALPAEGVAYAPYGPLQAQAQVLALLVDGHPVDSVIVGDVVEVVLSATPFYVESGGQVGDTGTISGDDWVIEVEEMAKPVSGLIVHRGEVLEGTPRANSAARAQVDAARRADITRNHTATHLLQAALRAQLGTHVEQRGSLVAPDRLRFDFTHDSKIDDAALKAIETAVNGVLLRNFAVSAQDKTLDQARKEGAMALFGEKYGERVRTISIQRDDERYSYELCGGIHVPTTAEIGTFVIVNEGSVSAGVRRLEALTGRGAVSYLQDSLDQLAHISQRLGTTTEHAATRVDALQDELNAAHKHIALLQQKMARTTFEALLGKLAPINGVDALIEAVDSQTLDGLREMADLFRTKVKRGVLVLGSISDGKPQLLVAVSDDLTKQGLHAGNLIKQLAAIVGGGGGGRPNLATAGGRDAAKLPDALLAAKDLIAAAYKA